MAAVTVIKDKKFHVLRFLGIDDTQTRTRTRARAHTHTYARAHTHVHTILVKQEGTPPS